MFFFFRFFLIIFFARQSPFDSSFILHPVCFCCCYTHYYLNTNTDTTSPLSVSVYFSVRRFTQQISEFCALVFLSSPHPCMCAADSTTSTLNSSFKGHTSLLHPFTSLSRHSFSSSLQFMRYLSYG